MRRFAVAIAAATVAVSAARAANPITRELYTADPSPISYHDTLWIFTGHDENVASTGFIMNDWYLFSTADLSSYKNWGSPLRATNFPWSSGAAFASHVIERDGKFYWYVAALHKSIKVNEGFGIGVAVASHPKGPWTPVAAPLVTDNTKNSIDLNIDPAVYVDLDGTAWLYWGSWSAARRVKLKSNMTEIDGNVETVTATGFFEAPWVHRFDGNYYFSYASGYPSTTNYAMAANLAGPWNAKGVINTKMTNSETNHQAILRHRGHWLFVYHTGDAPGGHTYHRSVSVENLYYNTDGTIKPIVRTATGPKKVDNAPIADGTYRLMAKHSGLALQDSGEKIVQMRKSASDSQVWRIARKGDGRTYSLRNAATGRWFSYPSAERLTKARTVAAETGIVIENASVEDGYMLFADSSKDHVGDVLDISTDPGKELVVWRRLGTLNQSFLLEKAVPTGVAPSGLVRSAPKVLSASAKDGIRLSAPADWILRDVSGTELARGHSDRAAVSDPRRGILLLEIDGSSMAVLLR
jgi:hypothetical protein